MSESTVKAALAPLKATELAPVKPVPLILTDVPTPPLLGVKPEIVGCTTTVKLLALVAIPASVVTVIVPVVAPLGTVALI